MSWYPVLSLEQVPVGRAVCVLVGQEQVALVRPAADELFALGNLDPFTGAMVMSRGIVGSRGDSDVLISPLHKQAYDLRTGICVDDDSLGLVVHDVRVVNGRVEVGLANLHPAARQLA